MFHIFPGKIIPLNEEQLHERFLLEVMIPGNLHYYVKYYDSHIERKCNIYKSISDLRKIS